MKRLALVMAVLLLVGCAYHVKPDALYALEISFTKPTKNADNTDLKDLAGFKVYLGDSSGNYTDVIDIGLRTQVSYPARAGMTCVTVTSYDNLGNESDMSNEACKEFTRYNAMPITDVNIK